MKNTFFVANNNGDIACHDCYITTAEDVLAVELERDPDNEQGWEILDADDEEEE